MLFWAELAVLFDDAAHLHGEEGLLVLGGLLNDLLQQADRRFDVPGEAHPLR